MDNIIEEVVDLVNLDFNDQFKLLIFEFRCKSHHPKYNWVIKTTNIGNQELIGKFFQKNYDIDAQVYEFWDHFVNHLLPFYYDKSNNRWPARNIVIEKNSLLDILEKQPPETKLMTVSDQPHNSDEYVNWREQTDRIFELNIMRFKSIIQNQFSSIDVYHLIMRNIIDKYNSNTRYIPSIEIIDVPMMI